ncbi:MFS transporter [Emticicia aquatilis]|uniref:MFS transporter n=1 Tax=Emticicia aquatilis TaxID=1537369 RepID=A0A916Z9D1_9BACT|nr:MFS transporter [Emticicia aquatilis]GGD81740.1 MFS transporter [Emticicia aquatilis]
MDNKATSTFTRYQIFIIAILAILQFTLILDFMVLSPLGAILMKELSLQPKQFGLVVSAYAFSAGASGLLAAGFADRFDRKKLLLFFYVGFIFGTTLCAMADSYEFLLIARIVTGIFGGVIGSISFAIISDLFKLEMRGRVMGFVQMAFSASQILGLPIGLYLANAFGWHSPFWMIVGVSIIVGIAIVIYMQPVTEHLKVQNDRNPFEHLWKTLSKPDYFKAFLATILLATGGFMLMPFGSAFSINNLKIDIKDLPMLYLVTGVFSIAFGPLSGRLSDSLGKYKVFFVGTIITIIMVLIYTNLGQTPLWLVIILNVLMFAGITARMISASSLMTAVPQMQDRGAFMSINSSIQQISGGVAAALAGVIVSQGSDGKMQNYPILGLVVVASMVIALVMLYILNAHINKKISK